MRNRTLFLLIILLFLSVLPCLSQQDYIARYSVFTAFSYLGTPSLNLVQRGFDGDVGYNWKPWITFGFDFSYNAGSSSLLPSYLNSATQAKLIPIIKQLPPGFVLAVPYNTSTYTYEAGPQFNYRHFKKFTLFARPALGALHNNFNAKPGRCQQPQFNCSAIITKIVGGLIGPSLSTSDTVVFYGFGGGVTWEATHNFGLRVATDFVHYNYFSDLLNGGRNSFRVTVGTKWSFGKNIVK